MTHYSAEGARKFCSIESDLSDIPIDKFEKRDEPFISKYFTHRAKTYYVARYNIKFVIGAADIKFELWFKNRNRSKNRPIPLDWEEGASEPVDGDVHDMLRDE